MMRAYLILLLILLVGCDRSSPEYVMHEYVVRISRVLDQPMVDTDYTLPELPPLKERQYELPDMRISVLQALDLLKCPVLSQEVAFRNSGLGKQLQPSQQMDYEKKLIHSLSSCIVSLMAAGGYQKTVNTLTTVLDEKQHLLPEVRWNTVFAGPELVQQLQGTSLPLPVRGDNGLQGTVNAFNYLARYFSDKNNEPPYQRQQLELELQQLQASHYSGQLIVAVVMLTDTLNRVADLLSTSTLVCSTGAMTPSAQRLQNVFQLFYVTDIQPYLVKITKEGRDWRTGIQRLLKALPAPPSESMLHYQLRVLSDGQGSIWHDLDQSVDRHSLSWQRLLTRCGMMPGGH